MHDYIYIYSYTHTHIHCHCHCQPSPLGVSVARHNVKPEKREEKETKSERDSQRCSPTHNRCCSETSWHASEDLHQKIIVFKTFV